MYVVVEYNQASGRPERLFSDVVDQTLVEALATLEQARTEASENGRGERYEICELDPIEKS